MKKIFVLLTILTLTLNSFVSLAFAQTATDSAQNTDPNPSVQNNLTGTGSVIPVSSKSASFSAAQSTPSPFYDSFVNSSLAPAKSFTGPDIFSIQPSFDIASSPQLVDTTSDISSKWTIASNTKHDLRGNEEYQVNLDNIPPQNVHAQVYDENGNPVSVDFQKISTIMGTSIQILPPSNFKPGKYTLKLIDKNGKVQTQDFTWGVLAINTDKSIYLPNETANLAMAVLDDSGNMVCDAGVTLAITDPNGQTTILSTSDKSIIINPQCRLHNFSLTPDYEAYYKVSEAGTYNMTLTANTQNGSRTITDAFQVKNSVPFDVTRQTGTRIYPPDTYPVNLNIKVNKDFKGQIIDYVPNSFTILSSSESAAPVFDVKQIATPIKNASGTYSSINLSLPFSGTRMETLGFGDKLLDPKEKDLYAQFGLAGHDGLDFAMPIGTPILAADDGTVVMAGGVIYGTTVVIQHSWGRSYYGHLSKVEVKLGQTITKGKEIGLSGNSGITTGPHLHFGIKLNSNDPSNGFYGKVDPSLYLGLTPQQNTKLNVNDKTKAIVWNVDVKKGDVLNLSYNFKMPNVSPYFYTIGPLSFVQGSQVVFQEARQWQLAADAATVIIITTSYTDPCGSNCWTVPTNWNNSNFTIEAIGGGAGGGGGASGGNGPNSAGGGGGAGGGGEYRKVTNTNVGPYTPGTSIAFSIGTGGGGGGSNTNGTAGTATTWNSTSLIANGGSLGNAGSGTTAGSGGSGGTGGTGAGGNFNGGTGGTGAGGSNNNGWGGGGGAGSGGTTANGVNGVTATAQTGAAGGAGGAASGGGAGTAGGGTGGNGTVWTDTSTSATAGSGGGGGGGTGGTNPGVGATGGNGGNYGGGGAGGGGGSRKNGGGGGGSGINGVIVITYTSVANTTEFGYRWRSDDGNETTGTSLAAQNTAITGMTINTNYRLRFLVYNSGGSSAGGQTFRLDYAALSGTCSTSTYAAVPTTSGTDPFYSHSTTFYTNGVSSFNVSSGPAVITDPSGGTFTAGQLMSTGNTTSSITLAGGGFTEIEYNFEANSNAVGGGSYCFRVSNAGAAINTYSQYAQATILSSGPTLDQLLRHGEWFNSSGVRQPFTF